jgi:magnesium transporter
MNKDTNISVLRVLLEEGKNQEFYNACKDLHPAVIAGALEEESPEKVWEILKNLNLFYRTAIFNHFDHDYQVEIVETLPRKEIAGLLTDMPPDERADLFKLMPDELREEILPALAHAEREDIRRLTSYEEGTAGAVMTSDYATLSQEFTVREAIDWLRKVAPNSETIYYAYVLDEARRLIGFVSLKDLILARLDAKIDKIIHTDFIYARVNEDQEIAARKIQKFNLIALPVLKDNDELVGIITHDDALDIITQEQQEDLERLMAIGGSHEALIYMKTSAWGHFRNRAFWVLALAFIGLFSGFIVQFFEGILLQFTILAIFMPMLVDTGGNTGSQSATLVVRALALNEINPGDIFRVLFKEFQVSLLLGIVLGALAFGRVLVFGGGSSLPAGFTVWNIGFAVSLALSLQVISATLIGVLLPMGAAKLKLDPAVVASPALTTIVDITGLLIYFTTAKIVLGL